MAVEPTFFDTPTAFRAWLEQHHDSVSALLVGFHKKGSGRGGMTYGEALDEALRFGWVDGVRESLDAASYTIRFSQRKRGSIWSAVNIRRVGELAAAGRMAPPGIAVLENRDPSRANLYSFENPIAFDPALEATFRDNAAAWEFWLAQPPGYRRTAAHWVMSAKYGATRLRRLDRLVEDSENGRRSDAVTSPRRRASR